MSLDLFFFKKGVNIEDIRTNISDLYAKQRAIQDEIEQYEDDYKDALLHSVNITHNLNEMAKAAGLYEVLWKPEDLGITFASQMVERLEKGIKKLVENPDKYKAFNPRETGNYIKEQFCRHCRQNHPIN